MTDELQDRVQEPFTGFRFAPAEPPSTPEAPSTPAAPTSAAPAAQTLAATFALDRRPRAKQRSTGILDWVAFALAFLAPPIGFLTGVIAVMVGARGRGWAAGISKAAIAIGLVLSAVLSVGAVTLIKNSNTAAAHAATVASSAKWCAAIQKDPATLSSDTYGWPAIGDSVAASLPAMEVYVAKWNGLVRLAPAGIKVETQKIASTASQITDSVRTTRVLDDSGNVARMQQAVSSSGIPAWVSDYCE